VLVPKESSALPGADVKETTVAGLSPVKGDTIQSFGKFQRS
jgi:hypothetical protein